MRLAKRIATVTLAAVLAVSMLTACGGGGSSTGGNENGGSQKPSNPGVSDTDKPGDGNTENPGNNNETPPAGDDNTTIRYADTRTAKYFEARHVTQGNVYLEATVKYDGWEGPIVYARKGQTARYNWDFKHTVNTGRSTSENRLAIGDTVYILDTTKKQYALFTDEYKRATEQDMKEAADSARCANGYFIVPADDSSLKEIKIGECEVNGKKYYAETMWIRTSGDDQSWWGHGFIYCFEGNDLKYVVQKKSDGSMDAMVTIKNVKPNPDQSLMEIPADYEQVKN